VSHQHERRKPWSWRYTIPGIGLATLGGYLLSLFSVWAELVAVVVFAAAAGMLCIVLMSLTGSTVPDYLAAISLLAAALILWKRPELRRSARGKQPS
jgi:hypothetical protein